MKNNLNSNFKNILIKATFLLFATVLITGCNEDKFFELERPTQSPWNSVNDLEFSVNDSYKALFNSVVWQDPHAMTIVKDFVVSDLTDHIPDRLEHGFIFWYPRVFDKESTGTLDETSWQVLYRAVTAANAPLTFLEDKLEAGEDPFPGMTSADRETVKRQMGELYLMRAFTYYIVSKHFLPPYSTDAANNVPVIPFNLRFQQNPDAIRTPNLASITEVYDQLVVDFQRAKDLLPASYSVQGRGNKYAAAASLYRIHWLMGNHDEALDELDYVINSGKFNLNEEPIAAWNRNFGEGEASEVIWERSENLNRLEAPRNLAWITKVGHYRATNGGRDENHQHSWASSVHLSHWACEKIGWMDPGTKEPTADALADKRYDQLYYFLKVIPEGGVPADFAPAEYERQYLQQTKNAIWTDKFYRAAVGYNSQIPLIRLAELYLSRATIRLQNGDVAGATADINVIRNRAGLGDFVGTLTENDIEIERIKEMAGEGDRVFYLYGMNKPIDGNKFTQTGEAIPAIQPPYSQVFVKLPASETNFLNN